MEYLNNERNKSGLRVIKTARDKKSINEAVKNNLKLLIKKVEPSDKIQSKYSVIQNKISGEIEVIGDYRAGIFNESSKNYETVIDWTFYYPYKFKSPYAAYLIPKDIKTGERVFIEDLIEDYIGEINHSQNVTYRLESCDAIWNGLKFEIQFDEEKNVSHFIG